MAIRPDGLIEARHNLTAKENNLIDMVLNTIKDDGKYKYEIDIEKYKELYNQGSTNIYRDLKNAADELFEKHNKFYIKDKITGDERKFVWFSLLDYVKKEGKISFEIGDTLKKMMLEMKKRIYFKIEYPINFKSIYSKRIYYMLKSFEDTGWRSDKIDDLKYKLNCPEGYSNYAIFKLKVLDIAFKEINEGSDINFEFIPIKTGRKVTSIKFTITTNTTQKSERLPNTPVEDKNAPTPPLNDIQTHTIGLVRQAITETLTDKEILKLLKVSNNSLEVIKSKYAMAEKTGDVKNLMAWLVDAIKEDYQEPKAKAKVNIGDSNKRVYDVDELEKKLLGRE